MSAHHDRAYRFYKKLGFTDLARQGTGDDETIYMGKRLRP
jgi:hypothetical protein